jgi:winged helix domain-containing protein/ATPase family protein associated with various cellular activities (AAA)
MVSGYRSDAEHLADELRWVDATVRRRVATARRRRDALPGDRTAYVSDAEVDWLLAVDPGAPVADEPRDEAELLEAEIDARVRSAVEAGSEPALERLARRFRLTRLDRRALVLCLAPELDRKYDKLYAYLQDDVTRKRPSADLVLDLLCDDPAERRACRARLTRDAPLLSLGILAQVDDPGSPSGSTDLARFLAVEPRVLGFLMGGEDLDRRLASLASLEEPHDEGDARADAVGRLVRDHDGPLVVHLRGRPGAGRRSLALAAGGRRLLTLDVPLLPEAVAELHSLMRVAFREAVMTDAAVYLREADELLLDASHARLLTVARAAAERGVVVFLESSSGPLRPRALDGVPLHAVELPVPPAAERAASWRERLEPHGAPPEWAAELGARFRLTPGQIRSSVEAAELELRARGDGARLERADLARAARRESRLRLGDLAVHVEPRAGWDDLVLPEDRIEQLHEVCGQVRGQTRVMDEWGFAERVSRARGVSALFSGPPGTGKTLAVEVIGRELELDVYKVDLSGVVSKFVGETEKNLARVFDEVEASDAILFFDEADALFGKRTKVSDAHDRYANVETAYLLQRLESHDGLVVLATNLRENMDEAFARRIRFTVDFPFPDAASRRRIWARHIPPEAPVDPALDLDRLAAQLKIAGGSIRNIVLNAAFLAADNGQRIEQRHVMHATRREYEKLGKQLGDLDPEPAG